MTVVKLEGGATSENPYAPSKNLLPAEYANAGKPVSQSGRFDRQIEKRVHFRFEKVTGRHVAEMPTNGTTSFGASYGCSFLPVAEGRVTPALAAKFAHLA